MVAAEFVMVAVDFELSDFAEWANCFVVEPVFEFVVQVVAD